MSEPKFKERDTVYYIDRELVTNICGQEQFVWVVAKGNIATIFYVRIPVCKPARHARYTIFGHYPLCAFFATDLFVTRAEAEAEIERRQE